MRAHDREPGASPETGLVIRPGFAGTGHRRRAERSAGPDTGVEPGRDVGDERIGRRRSDDGHTEGQSRSPRRTGHRDRAEVEEVHEVGEAGEAGVDADRIGRDLGERREERERRHDEHVDAREHVFDAAAERDQLPLGGEHVRVRRHPRRRARCGRRSGRPRRDARRRTRRTRRSAPRPTDRRAVPRPRRTRSCRSRRRPNPCHATPRWRDVAVRPRDRRFALRVDEGSRHPADDGALRPGPPRDGRARDHGSASSKPAIAVSTRNASATVSAWIEMQSSAGTAGTTPRVLTRPRVGFRPTVFVHAAGTRPEPAVSVPSANGTRPRATATAEPELDPPGIRPGASGLLGVPYGERVPTRPVAN